MVARMLFLSFVILFISYSGDFQALAHVDYDSSFTHECLMTPLKPQYGGGIVANPELDQGMEGWTPVGNQTVEIRQCKEGNNFIVASRVANETAAVQKFLLEEGKLYTFSAWVQASKGDAYVKAVFKPNATKTDNITAGWVTAREGCWSMLKGGLVVNAATAGPADLIFTMADNTSIADIWVDSVSLQPFTPEEWKSHQDQSIDKVRKGKVIFQAVDEQGRPVSNATVSIKQTRPDFPFGHAMNQYILENPKFQDWFTSRFKYYTVFENEMKWPFIQFWGPSSAEYRPADDLVKFAKSHNLQIRGHTVHWGNQESLPGFLSNVTLDPETFRKLVEERTNAIVNRYKGELVHWDVVNENIRNTFFDTILGGDGSSLQYQKVHEIDPKPLLFLNEYHTIERSGDGNASSWKYLQKIWQIRRQGYNGPLAIGLQGHFTDLNLPYIRSSIDVLESANLPIWITELDVGNKTAGNMTNVAHYLEQIMREIHSHRAVNGIMMWSVMWNKTGRCWRMCLTDSDFVNLPTGDVVDKFLAEWSHAPGVQGTTNADGCFETSLYHGEYEAEVVGTQSNSIKFKLTPDEARDTPLVVKVCA